MNNMKLCLLLFLYVFLSLNTGCQTLKVKADTKTTNPKALFKKTSGTIKTALIEKTRDPSSLEEACELLAKQNQQFCREKFSELNLNQDIIKACSSFSGEDNWDNVNQRLCLQRAYNRKPSSDTIQLCLREGWGANKQECTQKANFEEIKACASANGFKREVSCLDLSSIYNVGLVKIKACGETEEFNWGSQSYCLQNAYTLRSERIKICGNYIIGGSFQNLHTQCLESFLNDAIVDSCVKDFVTYRCLGILEESSNANSVTAEQIRACGTVLNDDGRLGNPTADKCLEKVAQVTDMSPETIRACGGFNGVLPCLKEAYKFDLDPELIMTCGGRDPQQRGESWGWQWFCVASELKLDTTKDFLEACKTINLQGENLRACFDYAYSGNSYKGLSSDQMVACSKGWFNSPERKLLCLEEVADNRPSPSLSRIEECGKKSFWFNANSRMRACLL